MQLTQLYQQSERDQEALLVAERALQISKKVLGPDHPGIASLLEAVATLYEGRGRIDEGDALRQRALIINERSYGIESVKFAESLKGLGVAYGLQGRNEEAVPLLLRALVIAEKALGPEIQPLPVFIGIGADIHKRVTATPSVTRCALCQLEKSQTSTRSFTVFNSPDPAQPRTLPIPGPPPRCQDLPRPRLANSRASVRSRP
jgi:tetratricopeptide (TPR) repeat protein